MALTKVSRNLLSTGIDDQSNATAITIDSSENVGIGVTPSSWSSSIYKGLQIGTGIGVGGIIGRVDGTNSINLGLNWYYGGGATNTYIDSAAATNYSQEAGTHRWFYAASGTAGGALTFSESMRIDSSGNVGIGTTSAGAGLHVNRGTSGAAATSGTTQNGTLRLSSAATSGIIDIGMHGATPWIQATDYTALNNNYTIVLNPNGGNVGIGRYTTAERLHVAGSIRAENSGADTAVRLIAPSDSYSPFIHWAVYGIRDSGVLGYPAGSGDLVYRSGANSMTTGSERMRIMSNGAIGMGFTGQISGATLSVYSSADGGIVIGSSSGTNAFRKIYHDPSSGILYFTSTSNAPYLSNAGGWTNASDIAIKKDIEDIDYGLETVKSLQPRKYKMKDTDEKQIGFVAQEIEKIVPEVVSGEDGKKGVSYGQITPILIKAIQEQQVLIEQLQAEVALLKGE